MENAAEKIEYLQNVIRSYTLFFIIFDALFFIGLIAGAILLIRFLKSKNKQRISSGYLHYTIQGQEEERARIARELHDTIAQDLRYCKSLTEKISEPELKQELSLILEKSVSEVRSMSYNLAPPDVTKNDLSANLMNLCHNFQTHSYTEFRMVAPDKVDTSFLSEEENLNLYRIVQESLNNIQKHAQANEVTVLLRNEIGNEEKGLYIFITDDGIGFDTHKNYNLGTKHFGLIGMKQRAEFIKVKLEINSELGEGTQIMLVKPYTSSSIKEGNIKFKS